MKKLKERWGIHNNWQLVIIFIVFGLTGSSSVLLKKYVLHSLGIFQDEIVWYAYWPLNIFVVFLFYQLLLICYGTALGQFRFFWAFEKKMWCRMLRITPSESSASK